MAIPPSNDIVADQLKLGQAVMAIGADVMAIQEVDEKLERSGTISQTRLIAEAMGTQHWGFAAGVIGTPGVDWRALDPADTQILTQDTDDTQTGFELVGGYGIGIVSKIAVTAWDRLDLKKSPFGIPLMVPQPRKNGKPGATLIYVADEPRAALAATLENGWTVINTHLSFVPGYNLRQLGKIKKWATQLSIKYSTQVLITGDLNLPKGIGAMASAWDSLNTHNTYPSWGAKIQFDYILGKSVNNFEPQPTVITGISDHLPISVKINS